MSDLTPLLVLWLIGKRTGGGAPPMWPLPSSPPPLPPPPLSPGPSADTGTPLADLSAKAKDSPVPKPKVKVKKPLTRAQAVRRALKKPGSILQKKYAGPPAPEQMNAQVADIQKMLNRQGAKLKPDGLYGPKTVAAYTQWADRKKQSRMIARVNPRTARVAKDSFMLLTLP